VCGSPACGMQRPARTATCRLHVGGCVLGVVVVVSAVFEARCTLAFHVFLRRQQQQQQPCSARLLQAGEVWWWAVSSGQWWAVVLHGMVPLVPCALWCWCWCWCWCWLVLVLNVVPAAGSVRRLRRANGVAGGWCAVVMHSTQYSTVLPPRVVLQPPPPPPPPPPPWTVDRGRHSSAECRHDGQARGGQPRTAQQRLRFVFDPRHGTPAGLVAAAVAKPWPTAAHEHRGRPAWPSPSSCLALAPVSLL
jgi:hypothetical protein